jgi:hypothetical protein
MSESATGHKRCAQVHQGRIKEGYLRGVEEDRPAVISVNMLFAALTVNDFLAVRG